MPIPTDASVAPAFERLPRSYQTAVLIVLVGLILFLTLALDSGGETAFMYATF